MKPKFAVATGPEPIYLAAVHLGRDKQSTLVFSGGGRPKETFALSSREQLILALQILLNERVALSVGGHVPGPAELVQMHQASGELRGSYVQISWSGTGSWERSDKHTAELKSIMSIRSAVYWLK